MSCVLSQTYSAHVDALSLDELIQRIYQKRADLGCVLDKEPLEKPLVRTDLKWMGRQEELQQLYDCAITNIANHLERETLKQKYVVSVCFGGLSRSQI